ncbi:MAG: type III polyketide synthase [Planctomycetes bacterium]|nr:type III polyketide synthase [Planctomycetota bacterium]
MSRILATATAVPSNRVTQAQAREIAARIYRGRPELERLLPVFERTGVETRHLVHPPDFYEQGRTFDERNASFADKGAELAEQAVRDCLGKAKLPADKIDHLFLTTTTGLATPSVDALLAHRLGMRSDVKRSPLFGLGCAGGVAALARAGEYVRAFPKQRALLVSLETCSLVFSTKAMTDTDLVGAALFGDGAFAAIVGGDEVAPAGPRIVFTRSHLFPGSEGLMGWKFTSDGMRLVLSREVPGFVRDQLKPAVERFLMEYALTRSKIRHFLLHPGGPAVLEAYRDAFGFDELTLDPIRVSMARHGNLSSAAVPFLLHDLLASGRARPGDKALLVALGPGFAAEMALVGW